MGDIRFDFNNMMSYNVGSRDGVTVSDLKKSSKALAKAHDHLRRIIANPDSRVNIGLEWTQLPFQDKRYTGQIQALGDDIAARYRNVLFLGIGGSYLGLKAAQDALASPYYNEFISARRERPRVFFEGNNLDPSTISVLLKSLKPKETFVVVISKSGETTETKAAFIVVEAWLKRALGKRYGRQIFAITDPASGALRGKVSDGQKRDPLSFRSTSLIKGVGGRYSEFNMGLLHLAVIGVRIDDVLAGAAAMAKRCAKRPIYDNPAYMYAALNTILCKKKRKSIAVMMPFSETLKSTADWYAQLLAESLGKKYKRNIKAAHGRIEKWESDKSRIVNAGRTPVATRGTNDLHSIHQNNVEGANDKTVTFIRVEKFDTDIRLPGDEGFLSNKAYSKLLAVAGEATAWSLVKERRPNCTIIMPEITPYNWGGLIFFFEMATAFEGELLDINAYDQPGVESYKDYMYYKLRKGGISEAIADTVKRHPLIKKKAFVI
ncbi:MAG: hypothetical protein AUJ75_04755 [Candidatus Omnitrophica bacterium CG1_02_49_10]|nr:MAG: hypothetical protein AUJ75_04755 [Candidatus Omnitrophica bacterium CG1_02_49_10]